MAKKPKNKLEVVTPLYGVRFLVFPTLEAAANFFGCDELGRNYAAQVSVLTCSKGIDYVAMTFRDIDEYCAETLNHECVHAAWRILELVGVKVSVDNQEPLAYLAGWLSKEVNKFMMAHHEHRDKENGDSN